MESKIEFNEGNIQFYIPKYFKPQELVSKAFYEMLEKQDALHRLWWMFDPLAVLTLDLLHEAYGEKMTLNDYLWGGQYHQRGLRWDDTTQGSKLSQHKRGGAFDVKFEKTSAEQVRRDCIKNPMSKPFRFISCVEANVSWFHFDRRNWNKLESGILVVTP